MSCILFSYRNSSEQTMAIMPMLRDSDVLAQEAVVGIIIYVEYVMRKAM